MSMNNTTTPQTSIKYDYTNQAYIINGKYATCNHPASKNCKCYGRIHAGEDEK